MRPVLMRRGVDIQHKVNHQNLQKLQVMTLQEALTILTTHQQWRRGADIEMAEPKVITEALDIVLAYHHVGTNEMIEINKTMTAVEYFFNELQRMQYFIGNDMLEANKQANKMFEQQIIDAFDEGQEYEYQVFVNSAPRFFSDTYYNQTYGSNGSDETKTN